MLWSIINIMARQWGTHTRPIKNSSHSALFPSQGLAVLMVSVVVLKHETSTLRQSHSFKSIDLKFGVRDNVIGKLPALPNLARIRWAVDNPRGGNIYGFCDFFIFVFYSSTELQPIPWTNCRAQ